MDINLEKGTINLYGKTGKLDTLIKKFTMLSGEQAYHFLINRGIQLPRKMNCLALMSVLNRRIKFLNSNSLSKDYFQRLQFYSSFTEQQLFNLFVKICNDDNAFYEYRYNLFKLILINFVAMDFSDGELSYIKNLKKASLETFEQYFNYISGAALEQEDTFDGQNKDIVFDNLENSASNQEILDIAGKYGIEIPQTLTEEEYYNYIVWYMMQQGTYNEEIAEGLKVMDLAQLETYCKRTNIPMNPNLDKKEYINYLIYLLDNSTQDLTSIKRFDIPEEYLPFVFTVDLKAVSTENTEPVKVIHYKGEENDTEEFNQVLVNLAEAEVLDETEENPEETIEEIIEPAPQDELSEEELANRALEAVLDDVVATEFVDAVYEDENKNTQEENSEEAQLENNEENQEEAEENSEEVVEENQEVFKENDFDEAPSLMLKEDLSDIEAASDEEIQELLEQNEESLEEEPDEAPKKDENFDTKSIKNDEYGSEKIVRLGNKSTAKTVFLSIILGILVGLLIFILVALVR